jgi:hypothetical protein
MAGRKLWICRLSVLLPLFVAGCGGQASQHLTGASGDAGGAAAGDAGTLVLQAWGGPSGDVATDGPDLEAGAGPERTCSAPLDDGACELTSCMIGGGIGTASGGSNFGPISASVGTTTVQLTYDGGGYGTVYFPSSVTLGTGGTMTFRGGNAAGVPKFDVSAIIPGLAVITSPVPTTDGGAAIIDTSEDLSVTWLPISIGQIHFNLNSGDSSLPGTAITVTCTFDGASGAGVVPHTLLSPLKTMSATWPTYGSLSSELDATTVVDGLTITTWSYQTSTTTNPDFNVTLQ